MRKSTALSTGAVVLGLVGAYALLHDGEKNTISAPTAEQQGLHFEPSGIALNMCNEGINGIGHGEKSVEQTISTASFPEISIALRRKIARSMIECEYTGNVEDGAPNMSTGNADPDITGRAVKHALKLMEDPDPGRHLTAIRLTVERGPFTARPESFVDSYRQDPRTWLLAPGSNSPSSQRRPDGIIDDIESPEGGSLLATRGISIFRPLPPTTDAVFMVQQAQREFLERVRAIFIAIHTNDY